MGDYDYDNPNGVLRYAMNTLSSSSNSGGWFHTTYDHIEHGDSGGPLFAVNGKLEGALFGDGPGYDLYTSTAFHIKFILDQIGYTWPSWLMPNTVLTGGTVLSSMFVQSARVCEYACDTNSACRGFTVVANTVCTLRSALANDTVTVQGAVSGFR